MIQVIFFLISDSEKQIQQQNKENNNKKTRGPGGPVSLHWHVNMWSLNTGGH